MSDDTEREPENETEVTADTELRCSSRRGRGVHTNLHNQPRSILLSHPNNQPRPRKARET